MTPTKTLGRYKIIYHDGVVQEKELVSHYEFETTIKPMKAEIASLETLMRESQDEDERKEYKAKIKAINGRLYEMFGDDWFTDNSPLFEATSTGILNLPAYQGGERECTVELLTIRP